MEPCCGGEDLPALGLFARLLHECGVPWPGSVVDQPRVVTGPVELGDTFEVRLWLPAESGHGPHADFTGFGALHAADPERDEGTVGREGQHSK